MYTTIVAIEGLVQTPYLSVKASLSNPNPLSVL
jgi:hypothetical protein